ncbi:MAG: FAD-dependent oxidoreductase [Oscillospiraceae bacterium]|nr:FAD-dependent oxidoreductase [Oscillospiraceae bacterium]
MEQPVVQPVEVPSLQRYPMLFSPLTIGNMTLKNRVVMMPMGTNYAKENGGISQNHIHYYEQRAKGGTGLIVVENVCVDYPLGSNGATQLRLDHDQFLPGMTELVEAIHKHGACAAVQINHAGASAMSSRTGMQPVSASDVPSKAGGEIPRPLTESEMIVIAKKFGDAAFRAKAAGFDAVEFHAGHSYLGSQFLSPTTNHRTDQYGGCAENRARFPKMIMEEIRRRVGRGYPILVRVSLDEFAEGGNAIADSLELMEYFCAEADLLSVSAGLNSSLQYQIDVGGLPDGWRSYMARAAKERFHKPCITMGNIRSPQIAEDILERGDADLIGIGRGLIAEPEWVNKVYSGNECSLRNCISCNVGCAGNRIGLNRPIRCTVNPAVDVGEDYTSRKIVKPCNVVVIGGGVAGLEAACTAAEVGCTVALIERGEKLGGLSASLSKVSDKFRMNYFIDYQVQRASKLKNLFALPGTEATVELVARFHPDLIVNATGSRPILPPIEGLSEALHAPDSNVFTIKGVINKEQVYAGDLTGKRVAVAGGGAAGVDAIEFFSKRGATVIVIEQNSEIGYGIDPITRCNLQNTLKHYPVEVYPNTTLQKITGNTFVVEQNGKREEIPFDYAYLCMGMQSDAPLLQELCKKFRQSGVEVLNIGDSRGARRMIDGVREGRNILTTLEHLSYFG